MKESRSVTQVSSWARSNENGWPNFLMGAAVYAFLMACAPVVLVYGVWIRLKEERASRGKAVLFACFALAAGFALVIGIFWVLRQVMGGK